MAFDPDVCPKCHGPISAFDRVCPFCYTRAPRVARLESGPMYVIVVILGLLLGAALIDHVMGTGALGAAREMLGQ